MYSNLSKKRNDASHKAKPSRGLLCEGSGRQPTALMHKARGAWKYVICFVSVVAVVVMVSLCLLGGFFTGADPAVKQYYEAAENGDAEAMRSLGQCYKCGKGVKKDEVEAVKWLLKAAKRGHEGAKRRLFELMDMNR